MDYLDGDIVLTKDEKIILAHDLYLNADLIQNDNGEFIGVAGANTKIFRSIFCIKTQP